MRLLLDTHVFYWANLAPKKLSQGAARAIGNARNEIWLSPITIVELADLERLQRLRIDQPFEQWVHMGIAALNCLQAPVTHEIAFGIRGLSLDHFDPADRILAATAVELGLTVVTADEKLLNARRIPTMRAD